MVTTRLTEVEVRRHLARLLDGNDLVSAAAGFAVALGCRPDCDRDDSRYPGNAEGLRPSRGRRAGPNRLVSSEGVLSLQLSMEICFEAPLHNEVWTPDIVVSVNGIPSDPGPAP